MTTRLHSLGVAGIAAVLVSTTALAQETAPTVAAGSAAMIVGTVSAVRGDGKSRLLSRGDGVFEGEHIITGAASYARLGFADGGSMVLRPRTDFQIERFRYTPAESPSAPTTTAETTARPALQVSGQGSGGQAFFRLLRGGFRAVSGLVGKLNHDDYAVRSTVATIGIRGTEYIMVFCDASCATDPMVTAALPPGETATGGLVSGVSQGGIVVNSSTNQLASLGVGQYTFTTASGLQFTLPGLPGFLAAEGWMAGTESPAGAAGPASPGAGTSLLDTTFSTAATAGGIAAAVAATAAAIAFNGDDSGNGGGSSTATSTATSTAR